MLIALWDRVPPPGEGHWNDTVRWPFTCVARYFLVVLTINKVQGTKIIGVLLKKGSILVFIGFPFNHL
jgi:hypothetical protein